MPTKRKFPTMAAIVLQLFCVIVPSCLSVHAEEKEPASEFLHYVILDSIVLVIFVVLWYLWKLFLKPRK